MSGGNGLPASKNAELRGKDITRRAIAGARPQWLPRRRFIWTAIVVLAITLPISLIIHLHNIREGLISRTPSLQDNGLADVSVLLSGRNVGEIAVSLLIAGLIGILLGWLLKEVRSERSERELEADWRARYDGRKALIVERTHELAEAQEQMQAIRQAAAQEATNAKELHDVHLKWITQLQSKHREFDKINKQLTTRAQDMEESYRRQLDRLQAEVGDLRKANTQRMSEAASLDTKRAAGLGKIQTGNVRLQEELAASQTEVGGLRARLAELEQLTGPDESKDAPPRRFIDRLRLLGTARHAVKGRLHAQPRENEDQSHADNEASDKVARLEHNVGELEKDKADARATVRKQQAQIEDVTQMMRQRQQDIARLERALESARASESSAATAQAAPQERALAQTSAQQSTQARAGTDSGTSPAAPAPTMSGAAPEPDDLKVIRGIGPKMEKLLHGLGITSYRQIASLTGEEIERVAKAIRAFPGRISRDDWIDGAKQAHLEKFGEQL